MKDGEAIYLEYIILGQIMPVANPDPAIDFDTYDFKQNECLLYVPLYNTKNGLFRGLGKRPGYITLRGDNNETFYSYGYDKEKSKLLFCTMKQPIPNMFNCTCFKKHCQYLLNEKATDRLASSLFMFLPSTIDRKEDILQYKDSVNLHPIDALYDDLKTLNNDKDFHPTELDFPVRSSILPLFYSYIKKVAETSNNNLIRNSNAYLASGGKIDPTSKFEWVDLLYIFWIYLPNEIQSKILSYFKFNLEYCVKFMRVSKSFKKHVQQMHLNIYNLSLGICLKKTWLKKTLPLFSEMIRHFHMFCDFRTFDDVKLMMVYSKGSIFRTFLHFFLCNRSCDGVDKYCSQCSHVRFRNFQNQVLFDDVLLTAREFKSKLGLDDRTVDFDVFCLII